MCVCVCVCVCVCAVKHTCVPLNTDLLVNSKKILDLFSLGSDTTSRCLIVPKQVIHHICSAIPH